MLKQTTIDQVNEVPLDQGIGKYVDLKKTGAQFKGKSPFVDEKTGSFMVSLSKGIWKCFSSGKGGASLIGFVMELKQLQFIEAVKEIADAHGIPLEYDDSEQSEKYIKEFEQIRSIQEINAIAMQYFIDNVDKTPKGKKERASEEMYEAFNLGFATTEWDGLLNHLVKNGVSKEKAVEAGLVTQKSKTKFFDFFRGRVMFPVYSLNGKVTGFSGRDVMPEDPTHKSIKVLNTKETKAYSKSDTLLGIYQAKQSIVRKGFACLVEGNYDVTSMHNEGMTNTVAPLGSAFTSSQAKILRKFTDLVYLVVDNDAAGISKIQTNTETLLKEGFNVMLFIPDEEGMDPDDYIKSNEWAAGEFEPEFKKNSVEAVQYLAEQFFEKSRTVIEKSTAELNLTKLLAKVKDPTLRNAYVKKYVSEFKLVKADVEKSVSVHAATNNTAPKNTENGVNLPSYLKKEDLSDFKEFGFYTDQTKDKLGYYFQGQSSTERVSNFIIKPLFQISSGMNDSKRILEIVNKQKTVIIEVSNKGFVSNLIFEEICQNQGNFWFNGTKRHFQKLKVKILAQFPFCREIRTLGWQSSGFFSFANGIVEDGKFKQVDSYGLCHHGDDKFFLPAFSKLYKEVDEEDDFYESDRYFLYRPSKITVSEWCTKMERVHLQNGRWAALFLIAALFRDFIFSSLSYFPHLFMFGQVQTGKSTCARSLNTVFFGSQTPFNLSTGTNVGFHRKIARTKNSTVWFDEYTNDIDEKRFQALKAAFDGAGHERGVMSKDNRTETTKINSGIIISGQYLPTRDDNSLNTRSIVLTFERKAEDVTRDQIKEFNELNALEQKGLSTLIVDIVKYRDLVTDKFDEELFEITSMLKKDLHGEEYKGRIMNNYAVILTLNKILQEPLNLPYIFEDSYQLALTKIMEQSEQVADSDALRSYWKMIEFMSSIHSIQDGVDYLIKTEENITLRLKRDEYEKKYFDKPKTILYVRLTKIHPLYMEANRKQFGVTGVPEQSIKAYMKSSKQFIGNVKSVPYTTGTSSGIAFDYDALGIDLLSKFNAKQHSNEPGESNEKYVSASNETLMNAQGDDEDTPF